MMARCKGGCGRELELNSANFSRQKKNKSGFDGTCKKCRNKRAKEIYIGRSQEDRRLWAKRNPEKKRLSDKLYRENNKEKQKKYSKKYREENKDSLREKKKNEYKNNKEKIKERSKSWTQKNLKKPAKYSTWKSKLFADEARETENNILEVRCKHCKEWYNPSYLETRSRVKAINGKIAGEAHFYCSEECKDNCDVYGKNPKTLKKQDELNAGIYKVHKHEGFYSQIDLNTWGKQVKYNANLACEICGKRSDLEAHHILPKSKYPEQALDPLNGVCLCEKCHKEKGHSQSGCKTGQLKKCEVKNAS